MAEQINVFIENKPGRINTVTRILADNKISIRAIVIQDRKDFGVMKMLVSDPHSAQRAISSQGLACAIKTVLAIHIDDTPGGLNRLLDVLSKSSINILDAYGFVVDSGKKAVWCAEVENYETALQAAEKGGFAVIKDTEINEL
jgi:hypothetical protein